MNIQYNLKEPYFQTNIALLDEDFDKPSSENVDPRLSDRELKNLDGYIMEFNPHTR